MSLAGGEMMNPDLAEAAVALLDHQVVAERMHAFHGDAVALGQEILPVRPRRIAYRRAHHAKRLGVVVGADVERIAVLSQVMREIVFHLVDARQNGLEGLIRPLSADIADFGRERAARC